MAEMRGVPWEFAFVARRDSCAAGKQGAVVPVGEVDGSGGGIGQRVDRELVITSARGVRSYRVAAD